LSAMLAPWCLGLGRGSATVFRLLVAYAQFKAERSNRHIRFDTLKRDRKWQQALGFVGANKK